MGGGLAVIDGAARVLNFQTVLEAENSAYEVESVLCLGSPTGKPRVALVKKQMKRLRQLPALLQSRLRAKIE